MGQFATSIATGVILLLTGGILLLGWLAARRRAAQHIVGRAESEAERLLREADTQRKEQLLAAREAAHKLREQAEIGRAHV